MIGGRKVALAAALAGSAGLAVYVSGRPAESGSMPLPPPAPVPEVRIAGPLRDPRVVVRRGARTLELYDGPRLLKRYRAAMGSRTAGDKEREGDKTTPLGDFYICTRNDRSRYHLFMGLSYPAPEDAERGLARGMISKAEHRAILEAHRRRRVPPWKTALGGEVGIHGGGADRNWTLGCIALSNGDVEELWRVLRHGDPVSVVP
jgi:hypothetical protein